MGIAAGLSAKETYLSPPGVVADLFEVYLEAHGLKKKPGIEDE